MKQSRKFYNPVLKTTATTNSNIIEVGETVTLVLQDGSTTVVTLTAVSADGREIEWDLTNVSVDVAKTSSQDATTAASDDTTGDALANALKTSYNAAQVDIATLFRAQTALGSPTSAQNATTAATTDGTRLALANALRTNLNAAQVDVAELFALNPTLGSPTSEQVTTPIGSDDATTQTLLNALKAAYNALQVDIALAFSSLDTGYFQPRSEDVRGLHSDHQLVIADTNLHDGPEDLAQLPRVPAV